MFPGSPIAGRPAMLRPSLAILLFSLALSAAAAAQDTASSTRTPDTRIRRDPALITREEIAAEGADARNLLEVVQRLRPFWINPTRGRSSINLGTSEPVVYVNNVRQGSPSVLQQYSALSIREIRHLRGTEASMRFGSGHENGAILLILR